jgi:glycine/D-amino acid oxidase-like deaminating enzyme
LAGRPNVLIVGAGIVGASIAWHLVRLGARLTIVEAGKPGGIATRNSWAWINASWGNPEPYFRLRVCAMEEWRWLERELPGVRVSWGGSLNWELPADKLEAFTAQHSAWGYDIRRVDRIEARRIEPNLAELPDLAVHAPGEGAVEPLAAARRLLSAARELGAAVITDKVVQSLTIRAGRVVGVEMESGRFEADQVVVAAGAGTAAIAATIGLTLPISAPPALLAVTKPYPKLLNGLVMTPEMQLRQTADGRLAATAGFSDSDRRDDGAAAATGLLAAMKSLLARR